MLVETILAVCGSAPTIAGSLIAYRWRVNLQRHKFDRVMNLVERADSRGGAKEAVSVSKAAETVLKSTGSEPRFERMPNALRRRRPSGEMTDDNVRSIESGAKGDASASR
jgi:hypothetical protein